MPDRSWTGRRWALRSAGDAADAGALAAEQRVGVVAARVLAARGLRGPEASRFLRPSAADLLDPGEMRGMRAALERLEAALSQGEHLRLVTDYDVDGTMSCLILHAALDRRIASAGGAARVSYHIPDRMTEGYGLSERAVRAAAADGVQLIVTADIGVRDHATVSLARALGLDVIVLDHHLPAGESVPVDAVAVVCPPQPGCPYPNKALAACGVSVKLAGALLAADPRRDALLPSLWKLAAIGTVADIVDLATPENRALVSLGLRELNRGPHGPGLTALLDVAGVRAGAITAESLGFAIGPRINAAGRLKDANAVVRLLRERDPAAARAQAEAINALNSARRSIQADMVERAERSVREAALPAFIVVGGPEDDGWHRGVNGIVAARVRDTFHRPCAVYATFGDTATGSVRSVPGVHAVRALDGVADLLIRYGGHPVAAGFTLRAQDLGAFAERLAAFVAAHHDDDDLVPVEGYDAEAAPGECTLAVVADLASLEPTGKGNPAPRFVVRGPLSGLRFAKERHVFGRVGSLPFVWWDGAAAVREAGAREGSAVALLGRLEREDWNGNVVARLCVDDAR